MKKTFLFLALLLQAVFVFAQEAKWGPWTTVSCFKGFQTAVLNKGYVKTVNQYSWQVKIKSNYSKKVTFNMIWKVGGEVVSIGQVTLNSGGEYSHTSRYFNSNSNYLSVEVEKVNFSDKLNCYAECDNGSPNQPNCDNNSKASTNTSNNQQNNRSTTTEPVNNNSNIQKDQQAKVQGVPKENTGPVVINFDFKNLFNYLNQSANLDQIKALFLNSGFKLCDNCYQLENKAALSKNNELLNIYFTKSSLSNLNITLSVPNHCPNLQNILQNWVDISELELFKTNEYGTKYIYNKKYMVTVIPGDTKQWVFKEAQSYDLSEFNRLKNKTTTSQANDNVQKTVESNSTNTASKANYTVGKELSYYLGKIENGKDYVHFFDLPKNVKTAIANCGCLTVKVSTNNLNAVLTSFHGIANYQGPFAKSIAVTYVDGTTETLYLKGELK